MFNLIQHLTHIGDYRTLKQPMKQVQGDGYEPLIV